MAEIKACPFCKGEENTHLYRGGKMNFVACNCGATGPDKETTEAAIEAWNQVAGMREALAKIILAAQYEVGSVIDIAERGGILPNP